MSEVKLVRLKSGEELIGKCVINEDGSTHIDKPVILVPTGEGSVGLMPYMPYTDIVNSGIDVPEDFVLFVLDLHEELFNHYNTQFGSGLVVPKGIANGPQGEGIVDAAGLKLSN